MPDEPQLKLVRYPRSLAPTLKLGRRGDLYLVCLARRSLGEGGSLLPIAALTWQCLRHVMGRYETDSGNLDPGHDCFLVTGS